MSILTVNIDKIREKLKEILSEKRYKHSIGAEVKAKELALKFGVDEEKAGLAALLHDNAKFMTKDEVVKFINDNKIPIPKDFRYPPPTLHIFAGEYLAKESFGVTDPEVLTAIRRHTLGSINMTDLDKIVFIADKIEDYTRHSDYADKIRATLYLTNNLDEAMLTAYSETIMSLVQKKYYISPKTIFNWNYLLEKLGLN